MHHSLVHRRNRGPVESATDHHAPNRIAHIRRGIDVAKYEASAVHQAFEEVIHVGDVAGGQNGHNHNGGKHDNHLPDVRMHHCLETALQVISWS